MTSTAALAPVSVDSTLLARVIYNRNELILDLQFCDGAIYRYFAVPAAIYHSLLAADSKGSFFNRQIRGCFRYVLLSRPR